MDINSNVSADAYFAIIPEWVLDSDISANSVRLYGVLRRYADQNGQCFPSRRTLAQRCKVSESTLDRCIKELINIRAISVQHRESADGDFASNMYMIHTLRGVASPVTPPLVTSEARGGVTSDELTKATMNESHEPELFARPSLVDRFNEFWACYPRKIGKPAAERAYRKIKPSEHDSLMEGLKPWAKYWADRDEPEFIPHPSTFLNQRRWEDQPTQKLPMKQRKVDDGSAFEKIRIMSEARDRLVEAGFYPAGTQLKQIDWASPEVMAILGNKALEVQQ